MSVSPALVVDRVVQTRQGAAEQQAQIAVLKEVMQTQESAAATLLNSVAEAPCPWPRTGLWARRSTPWCDGQSPSSGSAARQAVGGQPCLQRQGFADVEFPVAFVVPCFLYGEIHGAVVDVVQFPLQVLQQHQLLGLGVGVSAQGDKTAGLRGGLDADALALRVDDVKAVLVDFTRQLPLDMQGGVNLAQAANQVAHFGGLHAEGLHLQLEQREVLVPQDVELGESEHVFPPGVGA